jgi:hypothetical protein
LADGLRPGAGRDHRLAGRAHRLSLATPASAARSALFVAARRNQCSGEQAPAGMGRCLLSTAGVVAVEVGEKTLESFEEAF